MPATDPHVSFDGPDTLPIAGVRWDGGAAVIIDQRQLPGRLVYQRLSTVDAAVDAIRSLAVRGADAIGIAGAYAVVTGLMSAGDVGRLALLDELEHATARIGAARPTAVHLGAAMRRVTQAASDPAHLDAASIRAAVLAAARAIELEDQAACDAIALHGREELRQVRRILTHCNTGRLTTAGDGTALGIVHAKHIAGELDEVIACEARPLLQGGRLTAWELGRAGVPYRLIVDGAAGSAMANGLVEAVVVGCDRVAANGDTANKIGTYGLAVLAERHRLPFYVAAPLSSFDAATPDGDHIVIEERDAAEVRGLGGIAVSPRTAPAWNPAFDVTPASLITGFITDAGVLRAPYPASISAAQAAPRETVGV